jgi:predicted TIM-barrel enzyme
LAYADGFIVGTYLKNKEGMISAERVKRIADAMRP